MKKTYMNPTIKVVKIQPAQLICNSIKGVTGLDGVQRGSGDFVGGAADARGAGFSDDDWDEE